MGGRPCAVSALGSGAASTISNPVSAGFGAATRCVDQVRRFPEGRRRTGQVGDAAGALGDDRGDQVAEHLGHPGAGRRVHREHAPVGLRDGLVDRELLAADEGAIRRPASGRDAVGRASVPHHQRLPAHVHAADPESVTVHAGMTRRRGDPRTRPASRGSVPARPAYRAAVRRPADVSRVPRPADLTGPAALLRHHRERHRRYPALPSWSAASSLFLTPRCFPKPCSVVPRDTLSVHPFTAPDDRSPATQDRAS